VLLHGLFDDHRGWRDLPRRLASLGHRVLVPDLPGHGDSTTMADSLATTIDLIDQALPRGPLHLIGHSLGGAIATGLAQRRGDDICSLTLLAPAGLGPAINPDFIDGMLGARTPAALAQALALLDGGPISAMALDQELARLTAARPRQSDLARALAVEGQQKIDITADLAQLRCPLRVVFGTKDQILNWQDVARLPARAAIHLIAGAGHLPHLAAPDLIASFYAQEESAHRISA
jgi:pyruvate dehydrogenase E2 component (dihydrolipoamide acetyltransferase)